MNRQEALDRIAALLKDAWAENGAEDGERVIDADEVREILAEVTPEAGGVAFDLRDAANPVLLTTHREVVGGVLDRDQARPVIERWARLPFPDAAFGWVLDRLAACVRPAAIDRDALIAALKTFPWAMSPEDAADRLIAKCVQPMTGVTLTPEDHRLVKAALGFLLLHAQQDDDETTADAARALAARLGAAS